MLLAVLFVFIGVFFCVCVCWICDFFFWNGHAKILLRFCDYRSFLMMIDEHFIYSIAFLNRRHCFLGYLLRSKRRFEVVS